MKRATLAALREHAGRQPIAVLTRLPDGAQAWATATETGGEFLPDEQALAEVRRSFLTERCAFLTSSPALFARLYAPPLRLIAVGAVHLAQALVPLATAAGFAVVLVDPRRAFATPERFPATQLVHDWPAAALAALELDRRTAVVTLTHDPKLDDEALTAALGSDAFYIGALGSRVSHEKRLARLAARGLRQGLERIHAPVGLDLGGRSPSEVAIAILAQIVQARHRPQ